MIASDELQQRMQMETLQSDHPEELSSNSRSFNTPDIIMGACLFVLLMTVSQLYGKIYAAFIVLPFAWFSLKRGLNGRNYYVFLQGFQSAWIKYAKRNLIWEAGNPSRRVRLYQWLNSAERYSLLRKIARFIRPKPTIPLSILNFVYQGRKIGVVENDIHKTLSIVILGDGSPVASLSLRGQYNSNRYLAEIIKKIASVPGGSVGVSFVFLRRPADVWKLMNIHSKLLHPDIAEAELDGPNGSEAGTGAKRDSKIKRVLWEKLSMVRDLGADPIMATVITIKHDHDLTAGKKGKALSANEARRVMVWKVAEAAISELGGWGVYNPRLLDRDSVKDFLLKSWNVVELEDHYKRLATEDPETDEVAARSGWHWPQKRISAYNDYCVMDGTYHTVIRITGLPPGMFPNQPRLMHACPVPWMSVTLAGEIVSSTGELVFMKRWLGIQRSFWQQSGFDDRDDPKSRAQDQAMESRQEKIFRSRFRQDFMILLQVSASSHDELEDSVNLVYSYVRRMGGSCKRVRGECRQIRAVVSASGGQHLL